MSLLLYSPPQKPFIDWSFMGSALPYGLTFTRASTGGRTNAKGLVEQVAANTPRFDYDPTSVYWFNASASTLSRWNMALANVKSGVANARILCVGDSITEGFSAGLTAYKTISYPAKLAGLLTTSYGVPARWDCFSGNGNEAISTNELITDYTGWTNTWTDGTHNSTLGGWFFSNNGAAGNFTVQAVNPADTVRVWYLKGGGVMQVAVDGVNVQQIDTAGLNVIAYTDIHLGGVGLHSVSLSYISGGRLWVSAFEFINSTKTEVRLINAGWQGGTSGNIAYAVNGFNSAPQITTQNADLVIIAIGANDAIGTVSVATYTTNVQTAITAALAAGSSVMLVATSVIGGGDWSPYETALYRLALSNNVPLISLYKKWGSSYSDAKTAGLLGSDSTHPTPAGYVDMAASFASLLFGELTASPRGLLIEEQRANVIPYSDFSSAWTVQSSAVFTANQVVAPDGTLTAGALSVTTTIGSAYRTGTLACAGTATGSVWVRSQNGTNQTFYLMFYNATDGWKTKKFTAMPFWQRVTFTQALAANAAFYIGDFSGAAANLYVWGPQVEIGSFATSYVPTSGSAVTRAADLLYISDLSWFNKKSGAMTVELEALGVNGSILLRGVSFNDNTALNEVGLLLSSSGFVAEIVNAGTAQYLPAPLGAEGLATDAKLGISFSPDRASGGANGALMNPGGGITTLAALTRLTFGRRDDASPSLYASLLLKRFRYWRRALSDNELQQNTSH